MVNVKVIVSLNILIYSIFYYTDTGNICRSIRNLAWNIIELLICIKRKLV